MKKVTFRIITMLLVAVFLTAPAFATETLVPVGRTVGLELDTRGLMVVELDEKLGNCAKAAGIKVGDTIVEADGKPIKTAGELLSLVEQSGQEMVLTIVRGGKALNLTIKPVEANGCKRLGIYVREGITGIGTVTYYDPESGGFGALGHGVSNGSGDLLPMEDGHALGAEVISIRKGKSGAPGQLQGTFQTGLVLGTLDRNTVCGVFGHADSHWMGTPLPVGERGEVHTGEAVILSDLAGCGVVQYAVEIARVYPNQDAPGRNLLLRVTDEALLEQTGGIVQGMSGSPIIQDGKLIGAVTHVLVSDPTTGYGIFIENMLEAAA